MAQLIDITARIRERQAREHRIEIVRAVLTDLMYRRPVREFEAAMERAEQAIAQGHDAAQALDLIIRRQH
jgi:hypothetical protein